MSSASGTQRDIVIGAAYGYEPSKVAQFVTSLRKTGFAGTIALVITPQQSAAFAESDLLEGVELVVVPVWRPGIPDVFHSHLTKAFWIPFGLVTWALLGLLGLLGRRGEALRLHLAGGLHHPWCARHLHYLEFLARGDYDYILVSDTRDVVFQTNPSQAMRGSADLSVSIESRAYTVGEEYWNARWVKAVYGRRGLDTIGSAPVSCAGVSFGPAPAMLDYLRAMRDEILALKPWSIWRTSDQALHNYLLWTGRLGTFARMESLASPVATLNATTVDHLSVDEGQLVNADGTTVCVIHQYDRVDGLADQLTACAP